MAIGSFGTIDFKTIAADFNKSLFFDALFLTPGFSDIRSR
jgi:hypothetical protein